MICEALQGLVIGLRPAGSRAAEAAAAERGPVEEKVEGRTQ
jgi:hypothetical protein